MNYNLYHILIAKNLKKEEIISQIHQNLNLDNIKITKLNLLVGNRTNVYQFTSDNISFRWEQENKGGIVEIWEENINGKNLVKKITY